MRVSRKVFEDPFSFSCRTSTVDALKLPRVETNVLMIVLNEIQRPGPACKDDAKRMVSQT
jgi:hypothetical protein